MVFIIKTIESTDRNINIPLDTSQTVVSEKVNHHSMAGIITQLSSLAQYSSLVFTRLISESTETYDRILKLSSRLNNLAEDTKEVENYMQTTTLDTMLATSRAAFSSEPNLQDQLFTRSSLPEGVKQIYDKAFPPPNLAILDPYMEGGGSALKMYTNPNFFIEEWISEQLKIREEALKEKKKRRAERKKQREAKKAQMKAREEQQIQVTQIQVAKYDPVTGEKILVTTQVKGNSLGITQSSFKVAQTPLGFGETDGFDAPPPPPEDDYPAMLEDIPLPPPPDDLPSDEFHTSSGLEVLPPPVPPVPISQVTPSSSFSAPSQISLPPQAPILPPVSQQVPIPSSIAPMVPQAPIPPPVAPQVPIPPPVAPVAPVAPIAPSAPDAPIPPPIPTSGLGGIDLQSALSSRGALKPTEPAKPKTADARSSLLESIKHKNIALKSAKDRQLAEKKEDTAATSVASILSRRIAIIGESESEGSGSEEEWDD